MTKREEMFYLSYECLPKPYNRNKLYNTKYLTPEKGYSLSTDTFLFKDYPKYCPYCGHKLKLYTTEDDKEKFFNCDCSDALYEHSLSEQIEKLYDQMPKYRFRLTSDGSVLPFKTTINLYY